MKPVASKDTRLKRVNTVGTSIGMIRKDFIAAIAAFCTGFSVVFATAQDWVAGVFGGSVAGIWFLGGLIYAIE